VQTLIGGNMAVRNLENWVDELQASGRYSFLRSDAIAGSGSTAEATKKALQRLARKGRIAKAKDYFYVIVPLEYSKAGAPPPSWYIHDLMTAMKVPYYVGLLTAAAQHGASHHQPQEFQVVTDRSIRSIMVAKTSIRFFVSKFLLEAAVKQVQTPTGYMRISSPETTAVDLMRFAKAAGYIDNVATVMAELAPLLDAKKLTAAVRITNDVPNAQRLGYILDQVKARKLGSPLHRWIGSHAPRPVPLRTGRISSNAPENSRWHVLVDRPLEIEA
jgi:predicted transcriptional regulator of viral defense system